MSEDSKYRGIWFKTTVVFYIFFMVAAGMTLYYQHETNKLRKEHRGLKIENSLFRQIIRENR